MKNKGKRKVQGMPQSQTAALLRHQEELTLLFAVGFGETWEIVLVGVAKNKIYNFMLDIYFDSKQKKRSLIFFAHLVVADFFSFNRLSKVQNVAV